MSDGTIIIRNENEQKQDIAGLSRDTEHANNELKHIFDKEKEQSIIDQTRFMRYRDQMVLEVLLIMMKKAICSQEKIMVN